MLGISSRPMMNQVSLRSSKKVKKQNVNAQQPAVEAQTDVKPKKKMSKKTKGFIAAGAAALAIVGGILIGKRAKNNRGLTFSDAEIDRLVEELTRNLD